jgi:hypothetical protein
MEMARAFDAPLFLGLHGRMANMEAVSQQRSQDYSHSFGCSIRHEQDMCGQADVVPGD